MAELTDSQRETIRQENRRQIELARRSLAPKVRRFDIVEGGVVTNYNVTRVGVGPIDTPFGPFELIAFEVDDKWQKYSVAMRASLDGDFRPQLRDPANFLLRLDSGCETGQMFLDQTCECREQLHKALEEISLYGEGAVINIPRQDGRGMGLGFKLATLRLQQEFGVDTVMSAAMLEPVRDRDVRTYGGAIAVLQFLGIVPPTRILLATNNLKKTTVFGENNYDLVQQSIVIPPTEHTAHHLAAKQQHLGHKGLVPVDDLPTTDPAPGGGPN